MTRRVALLSLMMLAGCTAAQQAPRPQLIQPAVPKHVVTPRLKSGAPDPNAISSQYLSVPVQACIPNQGQAVGQNQSRDWVNQTGSTVKVIARWVWIGAASSPPTLGGRLDAPYLLQDITSGTILAWSSIDRYDEPNGAGNVLDGPFSVAPYYWSIASGDDVRLTVGCAGPYPPDSQPVSVQGMAVLLWVAG